ncbi:NAD-dependent epimerase/dehydratase family protein [bacterium]|nr:NAD-dependent epimerase/dehydratase family protein [bacterium]
MSFKQHVLITGGAGFIGSHLCEAFLQKGVAVTCVDSLVTGRKSNIADALAKYGPEKFQFLEWDVSNAIPEDRLSLIKKYGLQGVLHFACPASPIDFDRIPDVILKVDSLGTFHTVDLALKHNARYLLASTSEVYGDPLEHPQKETYLGNVSTLGPRACYDEVKRFAEAIVSTNIRIRGLNAGIVRIFNTYGPRMRLDDGRIVPELARQALSGKPLTIHGDGRQTRSFCYVSDLVDGIIRLFESALKEPVNCGNPAERTVLEFATELQKITKSHQPLEHLPARQDDPRRRCPDITKARTLLGWEPKVDLAEGLARTVAAFQAEMTKSV